MASTHLSWSSAILVANSIMTGGNKSLDSNFLVSNCGGWVSKWEVSERVGGCKWAGSQVSEWMGLWAYAWVHAWVSEWIDGGMVRQVYERVSIQVVEWVFKHWWERDSTMYPLFRSQSTAANGTTSYSDIYRITLRTFNKTENKCHKSKRI